MSDNTKPRFMLLHDHTEFEPDHVSGFDFTVKNIAQALSTGCVRYNGNTYVPYSVAQHCVIMSRLMEQQGHGAKECFLALHHDDVEHVMGDLARPIKVLVPQFEEMEDLLWRNGVHAKWSEYLPEHFDWDHAPIVKAWDWYMITLEKRDLWDRYSKYVDHVSEREWTLIDWSDENWSYAKLPDPDTVPTIIPWDREAAKHEFVTRHFELINKLREEERERKSWVHI